MGYSTGLIPALALAPLLLLVHSPVSQAVDLPPLPSGIADGHTGPFIRYLQYTDICATINYPAGYQCVKAVILIHFNSTTHSLGIFFQPGGFKYFPR